MVPELAGEVVVTVAEGPSGRTLQLDRSTETVIGDREDLMHGLLIERIALQLARAVEVTQAPERIALDQTRHKQARAGLELLARGKLAEGRAELERAARALGGLDKKTQAAIWYDLGVARYVPAPRGSRRRPWPTRSAHSAGRAACRRSRATRVRSSAWRRRASAWP
jgi:hypothetical protein